MKKEIEKILNESDDITIQKIGQCITMVELGILMSELPIYLHNKILKNVSDYTKAYIGEVLKTNQHEIHCDKEQCYKSKYADYIADTPEKAIRKFIDIYKGIKENANRHEL